MWLHCAGFIDDKARFPRRLITLCIDGVCILIGALMGTSPLTVVAESSVGIKEGGRTGMFSFRPPRPTQPYWLQATCHSMYNAQGTQHMPPQ